MLLLATGGGFLGMRLRQPLIVGFIAVGVLAGPLVLGLIESRYTGKVAMTAHGDHDARRLREAGADVVLRPFAAAAEEVVCTLVESWDPGPARAEP